MGHPVLALELTCSKLLAYFLGRERELTVLMHKVKLGKYVEAYLYIQYTVSSLHKHSVYSS